MPNDHRKPVTDGASRVGPKSTGAEKRGVSSETVIWSELHGDVQCRLAGSRRGCARRRTQLSADYFLGVPYNVASYAALTHALANACDLRPGFLVVSFGDVHVYSNHLEQVKEQVGRRPNVAPVMSFARKLPSVLDLKVDDFGLVGYQAHPALTGEVAI